MPLLSHCTSTKNCLCFSHILRCTRSVAFSSFIFFFFFSSRRRHTRSLCDWSSDVCSSDLRRDVRVFYSPRSRTQDGRGTRDEDPLMRERSLVSVVDDDESVRESLPDLLRSEEHTSELQSHSDLVCRLLLEKKKQAPIHKTD